MFLKSLNILDNSRHYNTYEHLSSSLNSKLNCLELLIH